MWVSLAALVLLAGCPDASPLDQGPDLAAPIFPAGCRSGAVDGQESDVDCGGSECPPCDATKACKVGRDCKSQFCTNNTCDGSSCGDKVTNGDESDVDCGGSCPGCAEDQACRMAADCRSATCTNGRCAPAPCLNTMKDGAETDVDCGGGTCPPCDNGKACNGGADCKGGVCTNQACMSALMCPANMGDCDGVAGNGCEVHLQTDATHCGRCNNICPVNRPTCEKGVCVARTTMSWTDMSSQSCTGMISAEIQKIVGAMPQGSITVTITARQVMPLANYGVWMDTFPNTDCVRKWLSVWAARDFLNFNNWNPGVCKAANMAGVTHVFVVNDGDSVVIYPDGAKPAEFMKLQLRDRVNDKCDLIGVNNREGFNVQETNTSRWGVVGDSLTFSW